MSKRDSSITIDHLLSKGYHPDVLLNYIVRLSGGIANVNLEVPESPIKSLNELAKELEIEYITKSNRVFDIAYVDRIQKNKISSSISQNIDDLVKEANSIIKATRKKGTSMNDTQLQNFIKIMLPRHMNLNQLITSKDFDYFFNERKLDFGILPDMKLVDFLKNYIGKIIKTKKIPNFLQQIKTFTKSIGHQDYLGKYTQSLRILFLDSESGPPIDEILSFCDIEKLLLEINEYQKM
ncbi:MAG: hypothetical protein MHPSP_001406 [Paramarteilia canceri]